MVQVQEKNTRYSRRRRGAVDYGDQVEGLVPTHGRFEVEGGRGVTWRMTVFKVDGGRSVIRGWD